MREIEIAPKAVGLDYEEVYFRAADKVLLNGWLIKHPKAAATVIFFHGNAGNISHRLDKLRFFYDLGLNVFIIDYRGYGKSQGRPDEEGIYRDSRAAYDYLSGRSDFAGKMIVYGESLGGAAAVDLAVSRRPSALIIDSAFSSAKDMAKAVFPLLPAFLVQSKFNSLEKVKKITIPKLFIHSANDEIVPFAQAEKLFKAAAEPKEFLKITGGHNSGFFESKAQLKEGIKQFLAANQLL
ncbi:MAG: alpha/beta hydrolase [Candidatus Omnitrophota bacterium]